MNSKGLGDGFTLLEMLTALTVAAVLTGVSLHVFGTFHHGIMETAVHYDRFMAEKATELRCRTRFVRGLGNCIFRDNRAFQDSKVKLHTYFRF